MKTIKKNVYYCDFCKKKSLRSLKTHERHCTGNPDRECRLCDNPIGIIKPIIEKYKKYFTIKEKVDYGDGRFNEEYISIKIIYHKEFTLDDIKKELDYDCPNCILAIIRGLGINKHYFNNKFKFEYKKELDGWWSGINKKANEDDMRNLIY